MSATILTFPASRQTTPPPAPPCPAPCVALGYAFGRFVVSVLWAPGSASFDDYDKALSYAGRLCRQRDWPLVNLAARAA